MAGQNCLTWCLPPGKRYWVLLGVCVSPWTSVKLRHFQAMFLCPNWVPFAGGWCWVRQVSFRSCQWCIYSRASQLFFSSFSPKVSFNIWLVTLKEQWFPKAWITSVFCWNEDFYFQSCFIQINGRRMKWITNLFPCGLLVQGKDFRNLREGNGIFHMYL